MVTLGFGLLSLALLNRKEFWIDWQYNILDNIGICKRNSESLSLLLIIHGAVVGIQISLTVLDMWGGIDCPMLGILYKICFWKKIFRIANKISEVRTELFSSARHDTQCFCFKLYLDNSHQNDPFCPARRYCYILFKFRAKKKTSCQLLFHIQFLQLIESTQLNYTNRSFYLTVWWWDCCCFCTRHLELELKMLIKITWNS